jgi:SAM-dependent methyltransferase
MTILVFPSCLEAAARFADEAQRWRQRVIGASSLNVDPYAAHFSAWEKLPFIGDNEFFTVLSALVDREKIDSIYTAHAPTFNFLEAELPFRLPQIRLIGDGPIKTQTREVEQALEQAERDLTAIRNFGFAECPLPPQFVAGLLLQLERLHGECSREKALALCAMMPTAVKGDVVEIGSLFGKSTYLLNRLADRFHVGATLAVDPWLVDLAVQHEAAVHLQNASREWNWELVYQGFLVNMFGCATPPFNYMRATSAAAYARYSVKPEVASPEFGTTVLAGSISILHIDGNHDEAAVAEDFALWNRRLAPGAWIVFDDYNWPHGDGPRKVADRAIDEFGGRTRRCFFAGGALFINIES